MADSELTVEVAFALPYKQRIVALVVPKGTTARQAVEMADLPSLFQELPSESPCAKVIAWKSIARCRLTPKRPALNGPSAKLRANKPQANYSPVTIGCGSGVGVGDV